MNRSVILLFLVFLFAGCASNIAPVRGRSTASYLPYTRSDEAADKVCANVKYLMLDDAAISYRENVLEKAKQEYATRLSLDSSPDTRMNIINKAVNEQFRDSVNGQKIYELTSNFSRGSVDKRLFEWNVNLSDDSKYDNGTFKGDITIGREFCYYGYKYERYCDIQDFYVLTLNGTYVFSDKSLDITYQFEQKEHESSFGINSRINPDSLNDSMRDIATKTLSHEKSIIDYEYNKFIDNTTETITSRLQDRIAHDIFKTTLKESTFGINFETSIARLQRRIDKFKYDKDNSTFIFVDNRSETYLGRQVNFKETLTVKLFPEKNMTVVVFDIESVSVKDKLTGKELYSASDASKRFIPQVKAIEDILKK